MHTYIFPHLNFLIPYSTCTSLTVIASIAQCTFDFCIDFIQNCVVLRDLKGIFQNEIKIK